MFAKSNAIEQIRILNWQSLTGSILWSCMKLIGHFIMEKRNENYEFEYTIHRYIPCKNPQSMISFFNVAILMLSFHDERHVESLSIYLKLAINWIEKTSILSLLLKYKNHICKLVNRITSNKLYEIGVFQIQFIWIVLFTMGWWER